MSKRVIIDLRRPLKDFSSRLSHRVAIPEYVLTEVVYLVFDVLIYELENVHDEPELSKLGNFYRDYLETDPRFHQQFLESFFVLLRDLATDLRAHGLYDGESFDFAPEKNHNNRSIVVKKFDPPD